MEGGESPLAAEVVFPSADAAGRRVAGVAAAARIVRELSEAGFTCAWLRVPGGQAIDARALADVRRLAGPMTVRWGPPPANEPVAVMPGELLIPAGSIAGFLTGNRKNVDWVDLSRRDATAEILRRTGKASDGPVSRWVNRPVSRLLSAILLRIPGFSPNHATAGTVALALIMFGALVSGGHWGLLAGGLLFHAASVFDGVDGEVARATFRSSPAGAAFDSAVDTATTFLFIIGLATNLVWSGEAYAFALAVWSVGLVAIGLVLVSWRVGSSNLDRLKQHYRDRFTGVFMPRLMAFLTIISSRDFFALANAGMIVAGFPMGPLYGFAVSASVWILFVIAWVVAPRSVALAAENA
jgi:CDP-L-myo-inositol myo-inositolphosphotransferase